MEPLMLLAQISYEALVVWAAAIYMLYYCANARKVAKNKAAGMPGPMAIAAKGE